MPLHTLSLKKRILCVILPFCGGYFFSYLMRTINAVISPELIAELDLAAADLGLLTSTYFFTFALAQIPVGMALDRFGPRRVAACLLVVAALGSLLFSLGGSLAMLAVARGLIGLGVAACLMAGLKGFLDWFDKPIQASLIGIIMACGALGALTTSIPVNLALPLIGWRGIFLLAAALALGLALITAWVVPEREGSTPPTRLADSLAGVAQIFRAPAFWRFAPQAALFTGTFMALQGLWVVPWLMNVNGYSRDIAADHLFGIGLSMLVGQLGVALLLARRQGGWVTPYNTMKAGLLLMMIAQGLTLLYPTQSLPTWMIWSVAAATGSQMYGVVASFFPTPLAGRATTAINLMAFVGAFGLQWGLGAGIDLLQEQGLGRVEAYRTSFALLLLMQGVAYAWMVRPGLRPAAPQG